MNRIKNSVLLPAIALSGGILGLVLRLWLLGSRDTERLLPSNHPAFWLMNLLAAGVVAALILLLRSPGKTGKYYDNFPKSTLGGTGAILAAVSLFGGLLGELISRPDSMTFLCDLFGLLAVFSLAFTGYCRLIRKRPNFLFHTILCIFFTLRLICQYRSWSGNPQPATYVWELLAIVCLMLSAYHRAAFDLNSGKRRPLAFYSLCALFFSTISLAGSGSKLFYLSAILWLLPNLCALDPEKAPEA